VSSPENGCIGTRFFGAADFEIPLRELRGQIADPWRRRTMDASGPLIPENARQR
jgi:hypothetical protein